MKLKKFLRAVYLMLCVQAMTLTAFAADGGGGDGGGDMWGTVTGFLKDWIPRLGGAVVVIGLVLFGLGWQRDDAEGKTRGLQVAIGGAIIGAVGLLVPTLMA